MGRGRSRGEAPSRHPEPPRGPGPAASSCPAPRSLFLSGEADSNAEIAKHLKVKPHTIAAWRKLEGWDELRISVDRRAAEKLVEEIATDRVALNQRHYKFRELALARLADVLKCDHVRDLRAPRTTPIGPLPWGQTPA